MKTTVAALQFSMSDKYEENIAKADSMILPNRRLWAFLFCRGIRNLQDHRPFPGNREKAERRFAGFLF